MPAVFLAIECSRSHWFWKLMLVLLIALVFETLIFTACIKGTCVERSIYVFSKQLRVYRKRFVMSSEQASAAELRVGSEQAFQNVDTPELGNLLFQKQSSFEDFNLNKGTSTEWDESFTSYTIGRQNERTIRSHRQNDSTKAREVAQVVQPLPDICNGSAPFLLAIVLTEGKDRWRRDVIRSTWGNTGRARRRNDKRTEFKPISHRPPWSAETEVMFVTDTKTSPRRTGPLAVLLEQAMEKDLFMVNVKSNKTDFPGMLHKALTFVLNCCPGTKHILVVATTESVSVDLPGLVHNLHDLDEREQSGRTDLSLSKFRVSWPGCFMFSGRELPNLLTKIRNLRDRQDKIAINTR